MYASSTRELYGPVEGDLKRMSENATIPESWAAIVVDGLELTASATYGNE